MIRHLIVFNIREGATHQDCLKMIEIGKKELMTIPGVIGISFGTACSETARYRYTLSVEFESMDVIEFYKYHPAHVAFADQHFRPLATDRITTDYRLEF
ncbi:Dabb family protein [Cohnella sp. REN36]|uniref:Dabb family protein n=1 Tax=Cohnella sp. REN36 TaxID=2887347 RepID=UPI001D1455F6|nr:Dabb family protein [Cohnella sp. REN36]MCC3374194.1 Dabb family protein [Cohnella sp. REN36]